MNRLPTVNGRSLNLGQAKVLKSAEKAEARGRGPLARALYERLEVQLAKLDEAETRLRALMEADALERGRGGAVEPGSPPKVRGRDGLETLEASGAVTAMQAAAGARYREAYEAAHRGMASSMALRPGGVRGGLGERPEGPAARQARAVMAVKRMEQAVADRFGDDRPAAAEAIMVLREVAGEGRSVRTLSTSGQRRARLTRRLIEALDEVRSSLDPRA